MTSSDSKRARNIDLRTVRWYIERDQYTWKEYESYLKKLPDSANKAEQIDVLLPGEIESEKEKSDKKAKGAGKESGGKSKKK